MSWIGFDLDGVLAEWGPGTSNPDNVMRIGTPIPKMVALCKQLLAEGKEVRIFTARVGPGFSEADRERTGCADVAHFHGVQRALIEDWCEKHLGQVLPVTHEKDFHMVKLYDDRCVQVVPNTGETIEENRDYWQALALRHGAEQV